MKRNAQLKALEVFVGIWNTTGKIMSSDEGQDQNLAATDIYEWLPGRRFLLHRVDARMGEDVSRNIEIVGWDAEKGTLYSHSYDDKGKWDRFSCSLKQRRWKIDGETMRFSGAFDADHNRLQGVWEMVQKEKWTPWLEIELARAG
jgi:hypothetical protein